MDPCLTPPDALDSVRRRRALVGYATDVDVHVI